MRNHYIFSRTVKGQTEMDAAAPQLEQRYRRFLALVDGRRTVAELSTVARPGEMVKTLAWLQEQGFIEKTGEGRQEIDWDDPFSAAALTPEMFADLKRRAVTELPAKYGMQTHPLAERIDASQTPEDLRAVLRDAEGVIMAWDNADAVRQYLQRLGRNLV